MWRKLNGGDGVKSIIKLGKKWFFEEKMFKQVWLYYLNRNRPQGIFGVYLQLHFL
jgi:hypothetical protein